MTQLETVYRERYEHFARVASAITGDGESGRDAVQTAFAAAVRARRSFRGTGSVDAWLWRIVVNEAKRVRREPLHQPLDAVHAAEADGNGGDELCVRALLATLPDRQKEVLYLRYYADLGYREIAEVLEIEVGTVSATLSAAHTRLRKTLRKVER